jgi:hypothetical protein
MNNVTVLFYNKKRSNYIRFHSNSYTSVFCFYGWQNIWMKVNQEYNGEVSEGLDCYYSGLFNLIGS